MLNKKTLMAAVAGLALTMGAYSADAYTSYQYTYYDKDGNGVIETNEFDTYVYNSFDIDRDSRISNDEWTYYTKTTTTTTTTTPTIEYQTFDVWDADGDGYLDDNEVTTFVRDTNYYTAYDLDGSNTIDSDEYYLYSFNRYDTNMDGNISNEEWMAAYR